MGRKYPVVAIDHVDCDCDGGGEVVYCWGTKSGVETIESCLRTHPDERVSVRMIKMTEKQYDALPEYDGDC